MSALTDPISYLQLFSRGKCNGPNCELIRKWKKGGGMFGNDQVKNWNKVSESNGRGWKGKNWPPK